MENEITYHKIAGGMWAALGAACLGGVLFAGAWWHLGTAAICWLFYRSHKAESDGKQS